MKSILPQLSFRKKLTSILLLLSILPLLIFDIFTSEVISTQYTSTVQMHTVLVASLFIFTIFVEILLIFISLYISHQIHTPFIKLQQELESLETKKNDEIEELINALQKKNGQETQGQTILPVVLSKITDGVVVLDADKKIFLFNKTLESLTGLNAQTVAGKHINEVLHFFDEKDQIGAELYLGQSDMIAQRIQDKGLEITNDNGKKVMLSLISAPVILEGGRSGWCIIFHDISQVHELEAMKIDFVSMAAHELRTPLTSVTGYAALLKMEKEKQLDDEGKAMLERLRISSEILANLVENLLNVTRIEQNKFTITTKPVDLTNTIKDAVINLTQQATTKGQKLELHVVNKLPVVLADAFRITQVLTNLVANAIHYTGEGGTITVTSEEKDGFLQVSVSDTGKGIQKDALPKLFTKFFRVSSTIDQGAKGTGLGLFISKSIIELHNGKIWVTSEEGKGSTFTFILPKADLEMLK